MFDLEGADYHDEFIEIFNRSYSNSVDVTGWRLSDSLSIDEIVDAGQGMILLPRQYCVILDGSYFDNSTTYDSVIPDSSLIVRISDNGFGSSGLSNSVARTLTLLDSDSQVVDSYQYTLDNLPGYSDEKINIDAGNEKENWGNSIKKGGTPGFRNSIAPYDFDLGFTSEAMTYSPSSLVRTLQNVTIYCRISNPGLNPFIDPYEITIFVDTNRDSTFSDTDYLLFDEIENLDIDIGEQIQIESSWQPQSAGNFRIGAVLQSEKDENPLNNFSSTEIAVVESRETVKINEIKFLAKESEPEWIELYNNGEEALSLSDWGIADLRDTCWIDSNIILHPGQFKVIAADSGLQSLYTIEDSLIFISRHLPTLNNSEDVIFLLNPAGGWVEQVPYNIDWLEGEDYRKPSLERIHYNLDSRLGRNWGPSTAPEGATPGKLNSLFTPEPVRKLKVKISPNPFSPDGDGFEDYAMIAIKSPADGARLRLEIYDISGHKIRSIKDNDFVGSSQNVVWDGRNDKGTVVRMGIYIIFAQILDDRNGVLQEYKETVVVAHKL